METKGTTNTLYRITFFRTTICFRINLENSYTTIAILLVEVPCGFTAAAMVCLAMALQEITIKGEHFELESSHRIHATVISILSLICWIHNAKVNII